MMHISADCAISKERLSTCIPINKIGTALLLQR